MRIIAYILQRPAPRLACLVALLTSTFSRSVQADVAPTVPLPGAPLADAASEGAAAVETPKKDATSPNNPYRAIVARNAFRLREPAPPPPPPTNPPPQPDPVKIDVKLAGLAEIKGVRYAYFMLPDTERPGQFVYPSLTDNPEKGRVRHGSGLEVREIDIKHKTVRVVNGGVEATLNFKDNGLKKDAVPNLPPGGKPGPGGIPAPGGAGGAMNRAGVTTTVFPAGGGAMPQPDARAAAGGEPVVFSRNASRASAGSANSFVPGMGSAPVGTVGTVGTAAGSAGNSALNLTRPQRIDTTATLPSIPVEHQYDILIRQRQAAASVGIQFPPIPGLAAPEAPPQP